MIRVVVQAKDGRWHFGPESREQDMRQSPHGAYAQAADASQAGTTASTENQLACSVGRPFILKRSKSK